MSARNGRTNNDVKGTRTLCKGPSYGRARNEASQIVIQQNPLNVKKMKTSFKNTTEPEVRNNLNNIVEEASEEKKQIMNDLREIYNDGETGDGVIFKKVHFKRLRRYGEEG